MKIKELLKYRIYKYRVKLYLKGFKKYGDNVLFNFPVKIEGKSKIEIGRDSAIGTYTHIWGNGGVTIGERVLIAAHCAITSVTHDHSNLNIRFADLIFKPVIIEDDVWLGYGVIVLPGITIGKGAVVAAGSVVTKNIEPFTINAGVPAKFIKKRFEEDNYSYLNK